MIRLIWSSKCLRFTSTLCRGLHWIKHARCWDHSRVKKVSEIIVADFSITITVNSPHNCVYLSIDEVVAKVTEEVLQIAHVDRAFVIAIDGLKRTMGCKVRHLVQVSDQIFDATKESKFMFKQSDELILEVAWQMIKSTCSIVRLILYSLPCIIIITR